MTMINRFHIHSIRKCEIHPNKTITATQTDINVII